MIFGRRFTAAHLHRVKRGFARSRVCKVIAFDATLIIYIHMAETSDVSKPRYYVYILYSIKDNGFYIGFTSNLKIRLIKHARGEVTATKSRTPLKLIHYEYFVNENDAKAREEFLKSGYGRKQLQSILKRTLKVLENI